MGFQFKASSCSFSAAIVLLHFRSTEAGGEEDGDRDGIAALREIFSFIGEIGEDLCGF